MHKTPVRGAQTNELTKYCCAAKLPARVASFVEKSKLRLRELWLFLYCELWPGGWQDFSEGTRFRTYKGWFIKSKYARSDKALVAYTWLLISLSFGLWLELRWTWSEL